MARFENAFVDPATRALPCAGCDPTSLFGMLSYAFVDAFTPVPRQEAIARLKSAIAAAEGVIVDFAFFSNKAIRLSVELEVGDLDRWQRGLEEAGIHLFEASKRELEGAPRSHRPIMAMLHVTFVSDERDLAIDVPHVPG